jgi:hypothetical protein
MQLALRVVVVAAAKCILRALRFQMPFGCGSAAPGLRAVVSIAP